VGSHLRLASAGSPFHVCARKQGFAANMINRQVVLVSRPTGIAQAENFSVREAPMVSPEEGQILVRNEFLSVEPAMRG
jgi:NADPH-dependent curcumin reductase CurA